MKESYNYPRVLIVTVNPLSTTSNNGKTYASFFKDYPKEKIAQLYFHREIPTSDVCTNYYQISDEDIINNILKRDVKLGRTVEGGFTQQRLIPENVNNKLKKYSLVRLARSLIWLSLDLKKGNVHEWLEKFNPEVIFFCGGNANYLYNKVLDLSKRYNSKIVYYITDDYVLPYFSFNIFEVINRIWTRHAFKRVCKRSDLILTIGNKMSKVYKKKYGIESKAIMNLVQANISIDENSVFKLNNLKFVYVGGLHSNRWKTLSAIGKSLERISQKGFNGVLEIYSQKQPEENILEQINQKKYSRYCGSLDEDGVKKTLQDADIVVHVESFDKTSKKVTYLSISTKISEYMASGKCILAVGPKDVASIEYLIETESGFVITNIEDECIDEKMINIFENVNDRCFYRKQAFLTAKRNHAAETKTSEFQYDIINLISNKQ